MPGVFNPPLQPAWPLEIVDRWDSVQDPFEGGYVQNRAKQHRKRRRFKLTWPVADQATRDYIVSFMERQLGAANAFSWQFPTTFLYQPKPALAPGIWAITSGSLSSRTYYVVFTWKNANGETEISARDSITVGANDVLRVEVPKFPAGVTSAEVYADETSGSETLQGSITTSGGTFTEPDSGLVAGASPPSSNTLQETMTAHLEADTLRTRSIAPNVWEIDLEMVELFV